MQLSIKFGGNIVAQSKIINIFSKFKMAAAAVLDFCDKRIWHVPLWWLLRNSIRPPSAIFDLFGPPNEGPFMVRCTNFDIIGL